jgi:Ca-activated chloride channel family protein
MIWFGALQSLQWREPLLLVLVVQPLLIAALTRLRRRSRLNAYADPALHPWVLARQSRSAGRSLLLRDGAYAAAWLLLALAAAGPRLPEQVPGQPLPGSVDIIAVVDVSHSMAAADVAPNRLRRARIEIEELMDHLRGDRLGVVVYAARAHLLSPPTADRAALQFYLDGLEQLVLPTRGSAPEAGLALARHELDRSTRKGAVVLITDGDFGADPARHDALRRSAAQLRAGGYPLYVLGVGTVEGDAVPAPDTGWLMDKGQPVVSRMDEGLLQDLAGIGEGRYSRAAADDSDWAALYDAGIAGQGSLHIGAESARRIVWHELYPWTLAPGIALLFFSLMPYRIAGPTARLAVLVVAGGVLALNPARPAMAADAASEQAAFGAYAAGDYTRAAALYESLTGYAARMGEAASRYRLADYAAAARAFTRAVLDADTDLQRGTALYNLGNCRFQLGDYAGAARMFADAMRYRPEHREAERNRGLALALQRRIDEALAREQEAAGGRMGRGPREARPAEGTDIDETASVSLAEPETAARQIAPLPPLPPMDDTVLARLIERGLSHARLAASGRGSGNADLNGGEPATFADAQRWMESVEDRQALLWKALFEREEGFDAALEQPRSMPGVAPW